MMSYVVAVWSRPLKGTMSHEFENTKYKCKIRLLEDLLGTTPKQKDVYAAFIASKAADIKAAEEEVETVPDLDEIEARGWTGFHRDEQGSFLYEYTLRGFLKEAARTLKQFGVMKQLRDKYERYVFVEPRKIRLPEPSGVLERPLRAMTAQGPRVALIRSDYIKAGTELDFIIKVLAPGGITEGCLRTVLSYGQHIGLGCWRTGGYGTFEVVSLDEV
jgi:hypothetical protein